jgi:uncharacterized protein (DUF58 family)
MLAVDISGSLDFGSGNHIKGEVLTHLAAILGFAAVRNNDQVGLLLFTDQVEHFVPPKKGRAHVQRILRDLFFYRPKSHKTKISAGLEHLRGFLKKKSHIFVMSDFRDKEFSHVLRTMAKKHDVVAVVIRDPAELEIPRIGLVDLQDAETGDIITVDSSSPLFQKRFREACAREQERVDEELKKANVDEIEVLTSGDYTQPLIQYFQRKALRR